MPKEIKLETTLSSDEFERRYRAAKDGIVRSQWYILWLVSVGQTSAQVSRATGYCVERTPAKHILLLLDRAGWHTSRHLVYPAGLHPWLSTG